MSLLPEGSENRMVPVFRFNAITFEIAEMSG